ncbi:MAG TPA: FlgO family outer membrane protein [Armatimonadota bacterium]|nr:FlgO family outer membrane protein [Armatimonadota bacterium]
MVKQSLLAIAMVLVVCLPVFAQNKEISRIASSITQQIVSDQASSVGKGKTLAIISFKNRCTDEDFDNSVFQDKLIGAFVKAKWFQVVERDRLDRAIQELKFNATGLVTPESQKQLGKMLGAQYMLTGTVSGDSGDLAVEARLVDIEKATVLAAASYPADDAVNDDRPAPQPRTQKPVPVDEEPAAGEQEPTVTTLVSWSSSEVTVTNTAMTREQAKADAVRWLVEEKILGSAKDVLERWQPEIAKKIYKQNDKFVKEIIPRDDAYYLSLNLTQLMRELTFIIFGKVTPRVGVMTTEQVLRRQVPDPAVETTITTALTQYGFQVVDVQQAKEAMLREAVLQVQEDPDASVNIGMKFAGEFHADIFALGESFAEERTARDGFDVRVEYRMVEGATGRILSPIQYNLAYTTKDNPNLDPTSSVQAKAGLQTAAERMSIAMCTNLLNTFGQPVYRVRVNKISSYENRTKIVNALKDSLGGATVTATSFDLRGTNSAVFTVETKRTADDIAAALSSITGLKIDIVDIQCRSLVCNIVVKKNVVKK